MPPDRRVVGDAAGDPSPTTTRIRPPRPPRRQRAGDHRGRWVSIDDPREVGQLQSVRSHAANQATSERETERWCQTCMKRTVVVTLLLCSCGSAAASQSGDDVGADPVPFRIDRVGVRDTTSTDQSSTTAAPRIVDAEAAFPARLALTTKDGQVITFSPHEDPIVTPGVMAPTGKVVVERVTAARPHHGRVARPSHRRHLRVKP